MKTQRHLQTLIKTSTFDHQRWMKKMPPTEIFKTKKQRADGARRPRVCRCSKFKPKNNALVLF
jgi:hypothetical protein